MALDNSCASCMHNAYRTTSDSLEYVSSYSYHMPKPRHPLLTRIPSLPNCGEIGIDISSTTPRFIKDTSRYWYKPNLSRDEAIIILKDQKAGSFVVRNSNSYPNSYGLAMKVDALPPNVEPKHGVDPQADLVRHFLIVPTSGGVRLKSCPNEPTFGSLAALIYQHTITPLALPCKLILPEVPLEDFQESEYNVAAAPPSSTNELLHKGAACQVIFINTVDTEALTGPQAIARALSETYRNPTPLPTAVCNFKVSIQGITLTDIDRKLFFRRHYPIDAVTFCGIDPESRQWSPANPEVPNRSPARIFGFVARKPGSGADNQCHLFCELDPQQPATAIVSFITKVIVAQSKQ